MEWTNKDTTFLKKFLDSDTGQKLISKVKAQEPAMESTTLEGRALEAAEFAQWRKDINLIKSLLVKQEEPKIKDPYINMAELDVIE